MVQVCARDHPVMEIVPNKALSLSLSLSLSVLGNLDRLWTQPHDRLWTLEVENSWDPSVPTGSCSSKNRVGQGWAKPETRFTATVPERTISSLWTLEGESSRHPLVPTGSYISKNQVGQGWAEPETRLTATVPEHCLTRLGRIYPSGSMSSHTCLQQLALV